MSLCSALSLSSATVTILLLLFCSYMDAISSIVSASSSSSISLTKFQYFNPSKFQSATAGQPRIVTVRSSLNPIVKLVASNDSVMGYSSSERRILHGSCGYVLEDVPHLTDFIPDLPDHFKEKKMTINMKYIDPMYMICVVPSNASDNIYCTLLAQSAIHGAMARYTSFTVGPINSRHAYIPFYHIIEKQNKVVITDRMWARLLSSTNQPSFMDPEHVKQLKKQEQPQQTQLSESGSDSKSLTDSSKSERIVLFLSSSLLHQLSRRSLIIGALQPKHV